MLFLRTAGFHSILSLKFNIEDLGEVGNSLPFTTLFSPYYA